MDNNKTVSDVSGFNFIKNPFKKETTIFECFDGIFICKTPEPNDRHKQMTVIRDATKDESSHHAVKCQRIRDERRKEFE